MFFSVIAIVAVTGNPDGIPLLAGFVGFQWAEDILMKKYKNVYVIVHYYVVGKEKHSVITKIGVWENIRYSHINYYLYN